MSLFKEINRTLKSHPNCIVPAHMLGVDIRGGRNSETAFSMRRLWEDQGFHVADVSSEDNTITLVRAV